MGRKPKGVEEFEKLLRPLSKVTKPELEKETAKYEKRKAAKKKQRP